MIALLPSALAFLGGGYNNVAAGKGGRRFTGATRQLPSPSLDDVTLESGAKIRNKIYPFLKGYMVKNIEFCEVSKRPLVCGAGVVVPPSEKHIYFYCRCAVANGGVGAIIKEASLHSISCFDRNKKLLFQNFGEIICQVVAKVMSTCFQPSLMQEPLTNDCIRCTRRRYC